MSRDIIRAALVAYKELVVTKLTLRDAEEALRLFDEQAALLAGKAIVPVKATLEMINAALPDAMRESDEDKYRAMGEIVCIWDAMLAASTTAAKKEGSDDASGV